MKIKNLLLLLSILILPLLLISCSRTVRLTWAQREQLIEDIEDRYERDFTYVNGKAYAYHPGNYVIPGNRINMIEIIVKDSDNPDLIITSYYEINLDDSLTYSYDDYATQYISSSLRDKIEPYVVNKLWDYYYIDIKLDFHEDHYGNIKDYLPMEYSSEIILNIGLKSYKDFNQQIEEEKIGTLMQILSEIGLQDKYGYTISIYYNNMAWFSNSKFDIIYTLRPYNCLILRKDSEKLNETNFRYTLVPQDNEPLVGTDEGIGHWVNQIEMVDGIGIVCGVDDGYRMSLDQNGEAYKSFGQLKVEKVLLSPYTLDTSYRGAVVIIDLKHFGVSIDDVDVYTLDSINDTSKLKQVTDDLISLGDNQYLIEDINTIAMVLK